MKTLGIDIGGTKIKYGVVEKGALLYEASCDTPSTYEKTLDQLAEIAKSFPDIARIGMGVPGVLDPVSGEVLYSNNLGWNHVKICADLEARTGLPVKAANDAQCAALGEALWGAGKGYGRVAMFTVGTGVGGGFVKDGKPERDLYGSFGYIFGHTVVHVNGRPCNCGRRGCLEAYASATALLKESKSRGLPHENVRKLFDAARAGEPQACAIVEDFITYLGAGAADVGNALRPHVIIIGGGVSASSDLILPGIRKILEKEVYGFRFAPIALAPAALGNRAGILGAASLD